MTPQSTETQTKDQTMTHNIPTNGDRVTFRSPKSGEVIAGIFRTVNENRLAFVQTHFDEHGQASGYELPVSALTVENLD
jgi:hypothetical protein